MQSPMTAKQKRKVVSGHQNWVADTPKDVWRRTVVPPRRGIEAQRPNCVTRVPQSHRGRRLR